MIFIVQTEQTLTETYLTGVPAQRVEDVRAR